MEEYVEIWQQASLDESGMDRVLEKKDLVPMIMDLNKKQEKLLRIKILVSIILLLSMIIVFFNGMAIGLYSALGLGIFLASFFTVVILLNRMRFRITYEERSSSLLDLARVAESKIFAEKKIFMTYLPLFLLVALAGFNLMYWEVFAMEEVGTRILYHLLMTGGLALAGMVGLMVRIRRFHKQFLPVLARIQQFKNNSDLAEQHEETRKIH